MTINDFRTREGWDKIAHTNPYVNMGFYLARSEGIEHGAKYPPELIYFVERIPSRQKVNCYLSYIQVYDGNVETNDSTTNRDRNKRDR